MNDLHFDLVNNFKCKKCGYTEYDKMIYTGDKTLDEEDAIIHEQYICRNCHHPFKLDVNENNLIDNITISPKELLHEAQFVDEGVDGKQIVKDENGNILVNKNLKEIDKNE